MSLQRLAYGSGTLYSPLNKCSGTTEYGSHFVRHEKDSYWSSADNYNETFRRKKSACENENAAILSSLRNNSGSKKTSRSRASPRLSNMNSRSQSNIPVATNSTAATNTNSLGRKGSLRRQRSEVNPRMSQSDIGHSNTNNEDTGGFWLNRASSMSSSLSDVTSAGSMSSSGISSALENANGRRQRHGLRRSGSVGEGTCLTPIQRKEKELQDLRTQFKVVSHELESKDRELEVLTQTMEEQRARNEEEMRAMEEERDHIVKDLEKRVEKLELALRRGEEERKKDEDNLFLAKEELAKLEAKCADLKKEMSAKEEQFVEYYLDTYKKGIEAARFEHEEEVELMLAKKDPVSLEELGRKLSRSESQLGRWQSLKLAESYYQSMNNKTTTPEGQAATSLAFLKDSFYHYMCDPSDHDIHLKAMAGILQFSEAENAKIKKAIENRKKTEKRKLFKKKDRT